jgi:biopolymer transport protein ExbD
MALRRKHRESEVSTESLNDIMFFLLLFFLILSTMVSPNAIKVNLPDSENKRPPEPGQLVHVGVNENREYFIDEKKSSFNTLEADLKQKLSDKKDPVVVLHLDKTLQYQDFIDVLQVGNKLNAKMVCATKPSN